MDHSLRTELPFARLRDRLFVAARVGIKSLIAVVVAVGGTAQGNGKGNGGSSAPRNFEHQRTLAYARLVISRNVLEDLSLLRVTLIASARFRAPTALNASVESAPSKGHFGRTG